MSLLTIKVFINALETSQEVTELVDDRIWPVAVPGTDDEFLNTPLPYIVVGYSGPNNQPETKDDVWEGGVDREQVLVLFVAHTIDELADLEDKARQAIMDYFSSLSPGDANYGLLPDNGLNIQGGDVEFTPWKPDYYHTLVYQCEQYRNYEQ